MTFFFFFDKTASRFVGSTGLTLPVHCGVSWKVSEVSCGSFLATQWACFHPTQRGDNFLGISFSSLEFAAQLVDMCYGFVAKW